MCELFNIYKCINSKYIMLGGSVLYCCEWVLTLFCVLQKNFGRIDCKSLG